MSIQDTPKNTETSLTRDLLHAARYYLGGRVGLIALAAIALVAGAAFNWSWLVAAGIAPLLLTALPCVAMCALGLCMNKMTSKSPEEKVPSQDATGTNESTATRSSRLTDSQDGASSLLATVDKPTGVAGPQKGGGCC